MRGDFSTFPDERQIPIIKKATAQINGLTVLRRQKLAEKKIILEEMKELLREAEDLEKEAFRLYLGRKHAPE